MTNRELAYIVRDQKPLVLAATQTVGTACRSMAERGAGSVLVVDTANCLCGIFTGRDAVRLLGKGSGAAATALTKVMTKGPQTVTPDCRAVDALRTMSEGGFRHVPVVDANEIRGVVSRGDFKGMELEEEHWRAAGGSASAENREIAQIVARRKPIVLGLNDTVQDACRAMSRLKRGAALVVDAKQRLKGIFTGRDAVRLLANAKLKDAAATRLGKAMTPDPVTIPPDGHAIDALRAMSDGGFRHLPVVSGSKVLGVVSRSDFTGREMDRLEEEVELWEHLR